VFRRWRVYISARLPWEVFCIFSQPLQQVAVLNKTTSFLIPSASLFSDRPYSRPYSLICRQPREYKINKWINWTCCHSSPGRGAVSVSGGLVSTGWRKTDWNIFMCRVSHGLYGRRTSRPITVQERKRCCSLWNCDQTSRVVAPSCGRYLEWFKTKCWKRRKPPWRRYPSIKSDKQVINCFVLKMVHFISSLLFPAVLYLIIFEKCQLSLYYAKFRGNPSIAVCCRTERVKDMFMLTFIFPYKQRRYFKESSFRKVNKKWRVSW
jgi:hypothetical protein